MLKKLETTRIRLLFCLFSKVSGQAASCSASESDKGLVSKEAAGSRFCSLFCFARFSSQALKESDKD